MSNVRIKVKKWRLKLNREVGIQKKIKVRCINLQQEFSFFSREFKGSLIINILNGSKYITEDTCAIYPIFLTTV